MGNTFAYDLKGDKSYNISAEKIQELYEQIRHVDDSMCGFVKTLDSLRAACELFLRHCDKRHDNLNESQDGWETVLTDEELALNLMKTLEESVNDQKQPTIESLAKMLNYLIDTGTDMTDESKSYDKVLSLDIYLSKQREEEKAIENMTFTDGRIESLRKQLKLEKELNKTYIKDIGHLEERYKHTKKELKIVTEGKAKVEERLKLLKEEYDKLERKNEIILTELQDSPVEKREYEKKTSMTQTETSTTPMSSKRSVDKVIDTVEIKALQDERDNLKIENEHLEEALNMIKRKEYIHVQIVVSRNVSALTSFDEVLSKIKTKVDSPTSLLYAMKEDMYKGLKNFRQDIPVLLFCNATECRQHSAPNTLNGFGFKEKDKIALVAIHTTSRPSLIKGSESLQRNSTYKDLGGIFDLVYNMCFKLHDCEMNELHLQRLTEFIKAKGLRKSVLEVHGLL